MTEKPRGRFWCSKCGWHRRARPEDPQTVHCGNSKCTYLVSQRHETKEEVRASLIKSLSEMCSWSEDYAKGFVAGAGLVEDGALAEANALLEKLVEAKMLKTKLEAGNYTHEEGVKLDADYRALKKEAWAKAFKWFGWDVEVEGFPPVTMHQGKVVDKLPPEEEKNLKHFPKVGALAWFVYPVRIEQGKIIEHIEGGVVVQYTDGHTERWAHNMVFTQKEALEQWPACARSHKVVAESADIVYYQDKN